MWMMILIAAGFFAAIVAIGYFGIQPLEAEREREAAPVLAGGPAVEDDCCLACNAPLRRSATRDEIVFEVEHRIDAELRDIVHGLHAGQESFGRIFRA